MSARGVTVGWTVAGHARERQGDKEGTERRQMRRVMKFDVGFEDLHFPPKTHKSSEACDTLASSELANAN